MAPMISWRNCAWEPRKVGLNVLTVSDGVVIPRWLRFTFESHANRSLILSFD